MSKPKILQVAIPIPFRKVFEYLPAKHATELKLQPGMRVKIPFGRSTKIGMIVGIDQDATHPIEKLKHVIETLDDQPLFNEQHLNWLRWISQYYLHPIGDTIFTALPVALRKDKPAKNTLVKHWQLTELGKSTHPNTLSRAPKQKALFDWILQCDAPLNLTRINEKYRHSSTILKGLTDKNLVEVVNLAIKKTAPSVAKDIAPTLNEEQRVAVSRIGENQNRFDAFLLDGVTGSGKTEVYLNIIKKIIDANQQVLFLLPEIGLTPQLLHRFKQRYGELVGATHSGLTNTERFHMWSAVKNNEIKILIGTRSAIFTPFESLGMIIIDEEHDISFKQQDGLRYSARDVAISRASLLKIPIVLGSATPSLESLANLNKSTFTHLVLKKRAGNAIAPRITTIDLTNQHLEHNLSPAMIEKMRETLERSEQVLLFLNRRGFAPVMMCHECGWTAICTRCDKNMTIHQGRQRIVCHHCGTDRKLLAQCPSCSCLDLRPVGFGTERTEQLLSTLFSDFEIIRIDRDTTRKKNAIHSLLSKIDDTKGQILIGTQMLAKGHDFPNVTFVGIIDADQGLFGADMRSAERMAQLITQVAGRAGRGNKPGHVAIQTLHPEHPLLQVLIKQGYACFSQAALQERRAAQLPPYTFAAIIRTESTQLGFNFQFLNDLKQILKESNTDVEILGPAPSPMERKAGKYRTQLLLISPLRNPLHQLLRLALPKLEKLKSARKVRWSLDVDPMEMG